MAEIKELMRTVSAVGRLDWIGIARARRAPIEVLPRVEAKPGTGIEGEHHALSGSGKRQITLIQAEHLPVILSLLGASEGPRPFQVVQGAEGRAALSPEVFRRNLVISGVNLLALKDLRFTIGDVLLEGSGPCPPCSRMEENLGPGGYQAMRGHGGITVRVIEGGVLSVGDAVRVVSDEVALGEAKVDAGP